MDKMADPLAPVAPRCGLCHPAWRGDALLAAAMAAALLFAWALRDWPMLRALHLPDTDDVVRLQQIRDWLGGQAFGDISQHRLGAAPGLAMHWSRLPDIAPAAMMAALTPFVGPHAAELATVIAWPAILFTAALFLVAAITRQLGSGAQARMALIIAAIAYPVTTIFAPGRIDHHALQIILLLVATFAVVSKRHWHHGAVAGLAATASIAIGLETAPLLLITAMLIWAGWIAGKAGASAALTGFAAALLAAMLVARAVFAGNQFSHPACDGFTLVVWQACMTGAGGALVLGLAGRWLSTPAARLAASGATCALLAAALWPDIQLCAHPYGQVDPLLARRWLAHVGEAQSAWQAPLATVFGYVGLAITGLAAGAWVLHRQRLPGWLAMVALQAGAVALALSQLRGAYAASILAAPALAMMIHAARLRGPLWLAAAWVSSAGIVYPLVAQKLWPGAGAHANGGAAGSQGSTACTAPATLSRIAALPRGTILTPVDLGAYALAATQHRIIAAPYHRNNAGNGALYRFFFGASDHAATIARQWHIDHVVLCADSFNELSVEMTGDLHTLIGQLRAHRPPPWLVPIAPTPDGVMIYRVKERLSAGPMSH